jgi:hypothetical protein
VRLAPGLGNARACQACAGEIEGAAPQPGIGLRVAARVIDHRSMDCRSASAWESFGSPALARNVPIISLGRDLLRLFPRSRHSAKAIMGLPAKDVCDEPRSTLRLATEGRMDKSSLRTPAVFERLAPFGESLGPERVGGRIHRTPYAALLQLIGHFVERGLDTGFARRGDSDARELDGF